MNASTSPPFHNEDRVIDLHTNKPATVIGRIPSPGGVYYNLRYDDETTHPAHESRLQPVETTPQFSLTLNLGNDAMQSGEHIANALRDVAREVEWLNMEGEIRDENGNTVGSYRHVKGSA